MQKWFDDGYFTPNLLMKRTHIDSEWLSVGELIEIARQTGSEKIFVSLPLPFVPPGLARRTESPMQGFPLRADPNAFNGPYQPAPIRSLRSSTLDSYLGGSNQSASPSSSLDTGRFGSRSPEPNAFSSVSGFSTVGDSTGFNARNTFNDQPIDHTLNNRPTSFNNIASGRASSIDSYAFNGAYNPSFPSQGPWPTSSSNINNGYDTTNASFGSSSNLVSGVLGASTNFGTVVHPSQEASFHDGAQGLTAYPTAEYGALGDMNQQRLRQVDDKLSFNGYTLPDSFAGPTEPFVPPYSTQQQHQSAAFSQQGIIASKSITVAAQPANPTPSNMPTQSPWNKTTDSIRRPGPFDGASHPTSTNTVMNRPATPSQPSPWGSTNQVSRSSSEVKDASPWLVASQGVVNDDRWIEDRGPNSLTFSNLGQHNQLQQQMAVSGDIGSAIPEESGQPSATQPEQAPLVEAAQPAQSNATPSAPKTRAKPAVQTNTVSKPVPASPIVPSSSSLSPQSKPAWTKEDDTKKAKPSGISLSLREIQEAEAKKADARKAAERDRERAARTPASTAPTTEEAPSFTASWGLPTSQAGGRANTAQSKEPASPNPVSGSQPVWTAGVKQPASKKSMKEIQEEEERRKKQATKETAAAAARRAYADSTNKVHSFSVSRLSFWRSPHIILDCSARPVERMDNCGSSREDIQYRRFSGSSCDHPFCLIGTEHVCASDKRTGGSSSHACTRFSKSSSCDPSRRPSYDTLSRLHEMVE